MDYFWYVIFFSLGLIFGSFFNVVGLRTPKKMSFATGRSQCPTCKNELSAIELIPVLSYIIQRGKCRHCHSTISPLYPIIELSTGLLYLFSFYKLGFTIELVTALLFISMLVIIFVTDITYMLIPNKILLFFLPFLIMLRIISPLTPWYDAIIGAVVGFGLVALIILVSKGGMGAGDMKLFGVLGIVVGWKLVLLTFFIAALFGAIVGGIMLAFNKVKRKQPIPFGPYIVVAAIITYFYGEQIVTLYLSIF